jgi:hypothetical protein
MIRIHLFASSILAVVCAQKARPEKIPDIERPMVAWNAHQFVAVRGGPPDKAGMQPSKHRSSESSARIDTPVALQCNKA